VLWLLGPSEDGYEPELEALLGDSDVRVLRGLAIRTSTTPTRRVTSGDALDLEGFGNPVLESVTTRGPRPQLVPGRLEITQHGFTFFGLDEVAAITSFLETPTRHCSKGTRGRRRDFNLVDLPATGSNPRGLGIRSSPVMSS